MIGAGWVGVALAMQNQAQNYPQLTLKGIPGTAGFSLELWHHLAVLGALGGGIHPLLLSLP